MNEMRPIRAKSGTNQEGTSAHNRRVMIDALRLNGALSRADLARATGLTKQAVSNIIDDLEQDGLVVRWRRCAMVAASPRRPIGWCRKVRLQSACRSTATLPGRSPSNLVGTVLVRAEANLPPGGPANGAKVILDLIQRVRTELAGIAEHSEQRLVGLCVAMPGPFGLATA